MRRPLKSSDFALFQRAGEMLLVVFLLSGCAVTSTFVSSIGARSLNGNAPVPPLSEEIEVHITDSPRSLQGMSVVHFAAIPYSSLSPEPNGQAAGRVLIKPSDIQWLSETQGEITLMHAGAPTKFGVIKNTHQGQSFMTVESQYRRWYGYPAQSLLLATVPLDLAINVVVLGGVLVSMPIVYGVRALQGESSSNAPQGQATPKP